jgi:hypothetical protein
MVKHLVAVFVLLATIVAGALAADALRARAAGPGVVWLVPRVVGGEALGRLLARADLRVVDIRAGGHLLVLAVPSLAQARWPGDEAWFTLRLPSAWGLAGCG